MIYFFILFIYDLYFTFYLVYVLFLLYLICIELLYVRDIGSYYFSIIFYSLISGISIDIGSFPIAGIIFSRKSLNLTLAEHVLSPT